MFSYTKHGRLCLNKASKITPRMFTFKRWFIMWWHWKRSRLLISIFIAFISANEKASCVDVFSKGFFGLCGPRPLFTFVLFTRGKWKLGLWTSAMTREALYVYHDFDWYIYIHAESLSVLLLIVSFQKIVFPFIGSVRYPNNILLCSRKESFKRVINELKPCK